MVSRPRIIARMFEVVDEFVALDSSNASGCINLPLVEAAESGNGVSLWRGKPKERHYRVFLEKISGLQRVSETGLE